MKHWHYAAPMIAASFVFQPVVASAATEIQWWHAFQGRLGGILAKQIEDYNASQSDYKVVGSYKGNYSETLNAGIAAFRAGKQPDMLMVYEVGTATMMKAKGAIKPVYEVMADAGQAFDPKGYLSAVTGYYTTTDGKMLSLPYNASTPVLYLNQDALAKAGLDPKLRPKTWGEVGEALVKLKAAGIDCPLTTAWQSWIHLENLSAYHDTAFATKSNGFGGTDTQLVFNNDLQVAHIGQMGKWAKDGLFSYSGRRNEGGARFRSGECAMFTESSAGYAGVKAEAKFPFTVTNLPYWPEAKGAPQNTIIGGASLWVMSGKSAAAYKGVASFMSYLSSPDVQAAWHQETGYLPITSAAYDTTRKSGFYEKNPGTDIAIVQMTGKEPTANSKGLRLGNFDQIRGIIDEELEAVWSGKKDAKSALTSATERGNKLLTRFAR
ncbi:MAG: sn-glycerol-3-phosphate ABC transporter substrate-binding protein UgpB [Burkholderiaceae bacterium]